jgi:hypothetical protein
LQAHTPQTLTRPKQHGLDLDGGDVTDIPGRESLIVIRTPGMAM